MSINPNYERFHAAFVFLLNRDWRRRQKALAFDAGVCPGFISDIKNGKASAGSDMQAKFAEAMGYTDFDEFLSFGRPLITAEVTESTTATDTVDASVTEQGKPLPPPGPLSPVPSSNVIPFRDARLEAMHKNLDAIYESGDTGLIAAIE